MTHPRARPPADHPTEPPSQPPPSPVLAIVGPTAAGKSDLAVSLARRVDAEIVNADSMQLYRGMDIGTAKLSPHQWGGVPHHLLDVWQPSHPASVVEFQRLARRCCRQVLQRGRLPVLVGGSGLYVRAVIDTLDFPGTDPAVRLRLERELASQGPAALHRRLAGVDPDAAVRILPSNGRRLVRALEVIELTGRRFTAALPAYLDTPAVLQVGLDVPRETLDRRIAERVHRMWDAGLVEEVRGLLAHGLREGRTASRALGYAQVLRHLDGELTEDQAREETIRATRRFARRQDSWFRRDPRVRWMAYDAPDLLDRVVALAAPLRPGDAAPLSRPGPAEGPAGE